MRINSIETLKRDVKRRERAPFAGVSCALFLLAVYLTTMAPSLTWAHYGADGGDLATAVARGSIPHPPGFPAYLLLGELFTCLPWGDLAYRLNLLSAFAAAAAGGLTAISLRLACPLAGNLVAVVTGLALGLSPLFWSQALITEVYASAAFFAALAVALVLGKAPALVVGLAWGIGVGAHPVLLLLAPVVARGVWDSGRDRRRRLLHTALAAFLGWGVMYGPVLLARGGVPSPWGNMSTLAGWWALVSGQMYHGSLFSLPPAAWPHRLLAWAGVLVRQFTPLGGLLTGVGWGWLWRERRGFALAAALAVGAFSIYAISYNTADSLVYLVPALPIAALWLGVGLTRAARWLDRWLPRGAWALVLLPLLQVMLSWRQVDLSRDRAAIEWAESVLQEAPPRAILVTDRDTHTFTLWYVHDVLGQRPDVAVADRDLWQYESYRRMMTGALELGHAGCSVSPEAAACCARRPIVPVIDLPVEEEEP